MQTVYAVKCNICTYDINGDGISKYIKHETKVTNNKIIDVYLSKEAAIKCMRNFAKQKDDNNLDRKIFDEAIMYKGEIDGKWYEILYTVVECTLIEAVEC